MSNYNQSITFGYTYLNDDILDQNKDLSRYSLNTLKHQFISRFTSQWLRMCVKILFLNMQREQ